MTNKHRHADERFSDRPAKGRGALTSMRERTKTVMLLLALAFTGWLLFEIGVERLGAHRRLPPPSVAFQVPLQHNQLREPLDSAQVRSLRLYAVPGAALADSLSSACAAYERDTVGLGDGPVWLIRWREVGARLSRRLDQLREALATDSAAVSRFGMVRIGIPAKSWLILTWASGSLGRVFYDDVRYDRVQLGPLGAFCAP